MAAQVDFCLFLNAYLTYLLAIRCRIRCVNKGLIYFYFLTKHKLSNFLWKIAASVTVLNNWSNISRPSFCSACSPSLARLLAYLSVTFDRFIEWDRPMYPGITFFSNLGVFSHFLRLLMQLIPTTWFLPLAAPETWVNFLPCTTPTILKWGLPLSKRAESTFWPRLNSMPLVKENFQI